MALNQQLYFMSKYKYYFKKPKSEIAKDILKGLAISGAVCVAAASPYCGLNIIKGFKNNRTYPKRKTYDAFYNLRRYGYVDFEKVNNQLYVHLTEQGKKTAGRLQIDALTINKPKKWDKKWRLVIFDIAHLKRIKRELFRGKLKELGFHRLQKSVWVCPYDCIDEIDVLREFFGLNKTEVRLISAENIEDSQFLEK